MITTIDARNGVVVLVIAPQSLPDVELIVNELAQKIMMEEIPLSDGKDTIYGLDLFDADRYG